MYRLGRSRLPVLVMLQLALASPALAEVCDKAVGDSWMPDQGPVWMLNPGFPVAFIAIVCGLALVAWMKLTWLGYIAAALLAAYAFGVVVADLIPQHEVYRFALREGCRSIPTDLMDVALSVLFAVAYVWLGYRNSRSSPAVSDSREAI